MIRDTAKTCQIPNWLCHEYINAIDIRSQSEILSTLRIYYTILFSYKHATLNANSDATLNFFFICFWVSNILPFGFDNRYFEFLLQNLWGWEGRNYEEEK